jgi:hypothetical protein
MRRRVAQIERAVAAVAAAPAEQSGMAAVTQRADVVRVGFAPIVRVDAPQREIELCATSEAVDSFGTIFDYAASKDAFTRWLGNVREMHERRAVGRRVGVRCDDNERKIFVRVRVSRGAQDTWEKVLDGTLRGASIGASNVTWRRQVLPVGGRYRLLDCIAVLRADAVAELMTSKRSHSAGAALAQEPGGRTRGAAALSRRSKYDKLSHGDWKARLDAAYGPINRGVTPEMTALWREYAHYRIRQLGESSTGIARTVTAERERS